jgi:hypothetical protein
MEQVACLGAEEGRQEAIFAAGGTIHEPQPAWRSGV